MRMSLGRAALMVVALAVVIMGAAVLAPARDVGAATKNGFDLSNVSVPADEILQGGPPKDGIPAIDDPQFVAAKDAEFLVDDARVLGVERNGVAKAYPVAILNWHEIVNDRFGEEAIVVSFCPLCGTGMAFRAEVAGGTRSFGVSGLLYNSDVLLYDRETESLWSQIAKRSISGPLEGKRLEMVVMSHTTWRDWRERYPDTLALSEDTGYRRDYARNPYQGYERSENLYFPVAGFGKQYHPKELVMGLDLDEKFRAYPFSELAQLNGPVTEELAGRRITVEFDADNQTGRVLDDQGEELPTVIAFWFAWSAFHPDSGVFQAP